MELLNYISNSTFLTWASIYEQVIALVILVVVILPNQWKEVKNPEVKALGWVPYALIGIIIMMIVTDAVPALLQYLRIVGRYNNYGAIAFLSSVQKLLLPIIGIFFYSKTKE